MAAYWLARCKIDDPVEYKKYTDRVPGIIAKYGGKVLARGGNYEIMEGPEKFHRFVVIEFPTMEQAVACHRSPEYQEAAAFRRKRGVGEVELQVREADRDEVSCELLEVGDDLFVGRVEHVHRAAPVVVDHADIPVAATIRREPVGM